MPTRRYLENRRNLSDFDPQKSLTITNALENLEMQTDMVSSLRLASLSVYPAGGESALV